MRRMFLFPLCLAAAALFLAAPGRTMSQTAPPSTHGKTAGETKKNIQVLNTLPAGQLDKVMDYFSSSLGVRCDHCHVIDTTGWYMDKDDKPTKAKARKMIQMVMDLNANNFGGRDAVTCYTCHRGSTEPTHVIPLPIAAHQREEVPAEAALPTADQLLAKYEAALGGADAIAKITTRKMTGVSVDVQGKEQPVEVVQTASGKFVTKVTMQEGMTRAMGLSGTTAWMSSPRGVRELPPEAADGMKREAELFPLARLKAQAGAMRVRGTEMLDGAPAYCVAAAGTQGTDLYYFDAASGLLVREATLTETMIGAIPDQTDYSDYRAVDGVQIPFGVRSSAVDPRDGATKRFTAVEQNVPVEESMFAMPAGKK